MLLIPRSPPEVLFTLVGELPLEAAAAAAAWVNVVFKSMRPGPPALEELMLEGIVVPTVEAIWGFSSSRIVIIWSFNTIQ